ncbi:MAG: Fic/DOC family N-terminal domain-containing protein [Microbacteriaceae bacterium]
MDTQKFSQSPIGNLLAIKGVDGRFGIEYNHFAYTPNPLSTIELSLSTPTWEAIAQATASLARLDQAGKQIPEPGLLRKPSLSREAQSTSALEGTYAPLSEVLQGHPLNSHALSQDLQEVLNYLRAAEYAFEYVKKERRISTSLLEKVHGILVQGTTSDGMDAGRIRKTQVFIGDEASPIEEARFIPMAPGILLEAAVQDLVDWIETSSALPVVSAAIAHYQFETLHPFNDGNGRIGRLLIALQLLKNNAIDEPLLTVSPWFEARKELYKDHLARLSATGDWDSWLKFFAEGIKESAEDTIRRVNRLLGIQQQYLETLNWYQQKGVIVEVANLLIGNPFLTTKEAAEKSGRSIPATDKALKSLVKMGLLQANESQVYNKRYLAIDVYRTFNAPLGTVLDPLDPLENVILMFSNKKR